MDFLIHHMLRTSYRRTPEKEALVHGNERLSYEEVYRCTTGLAAGLRQGGLKRGERVGIYFDASVPQVVSIFGVSMAGGVYVPINTQLYADQVLHIARDCQMTALITSKAKLEMLLPVIDQIPSLRFLIVLSDGEVPRTAVPTHSYRQMIDAPAPDSWRDWGISKDLAAILYTSGSTGRPKGVMLSHANVMAGSAIVSTYLEITEKERILAVLPFSFDAGMNQLMTAFQQGATLVLINFIFAKEIVSTLAKERISGLAGVPTVWSLLAQSHSTLERTPLPDLRYITNTGGAMPQN